VLASAGNGALATGLSRHIRHTPLPQQPTHILSAAGVEHHTLKRALLPCNGTDGKRHGLNIKRLACSRLGAFFLKKTNLYKLYIYHYRVSFVLGVLHHS
jgi:hypothetical protein